MIEKDRRWLGKLICWACFLGVFALLCWLFL